MNDLIARLRDDANRLERDGDAYPDVAVRLRQAAALYEALRGLLREALEVLPGRGNLRRRIMQTLGTSSALGREEREGVIEECARACKALRIKWEKDLGKGGEYWNGYADMASACESAIRSLKSSPQGEKGEER